MVRAHIISNGPSAAKARIPHNGIRIGVNTVGSVQPDLDWLCFGDTVMWEMVCGRGIAWPSVGFILPIVEINNGRPYAPPGAQYLPWEWLWLPEDLGYSSCVAIWAARTMGAMEIHLWGFDYDGKGYADGTPVKSYRGDDHWEREVRYFNQACAHVRSKGAALIKH